MCANTTDQIDERLKFSRHRHELPLLIAFLSVAVVELVVVHIMASHWSRTLALILSGATAIFLLQIGLLLHGLIAWPTTMDRDGVLVCHGRRRSLFVPFAVIGVSEDVSVSSIERGPTILSAAIIAHPNVAVRLREPVLHGNQPLRTILMRLDEPHRFRDELGKRLPRPAALAEGSVSNDRGRTCSPDAARCIPLP